MSESTKWLFAGLGVLVFILLIFNMMVEIRRDSCKALLSSNMESTHKAILVRDVCQ